MRDADRGTAPARPRRRLARGPDRVRGSRPRSVTARRAWIVLPDLLSIRVFFDTGIVEGLRERLDGAIAGVFLVSPESAHDWAARLGATSRLAGAGARGELGSPRGADRAADRRVARRAARLLPARDPAELPARLPRRADAARARELDARLVPRRPASTLEARGARNAAVVLQPATARSAPAARGDARRVRGARRRERAAAERRAVPRGGAPAGPSRRRLRRELGPHGRQGRDLALLRALHRPERGDGGRPAPFPRHRPEPSRRHRLAADRRLPASPLRAPSTTRSCAPTGSIPLGRSSWSWATRRRTRPTRAASWSGSSRGGTPGRGERFQLLFRPHPRDREWEERFAPRAIGRGSTCRSRASPTSRSSPRSSSTPTRSSRMPGRSSWTRSSTTARPSASSTTRVRRRASRGRRRTSSASTTRSSPRPAPSTARRASTRSSPASSARSREPGELADARRRVVDDVVGEVDGRAAERAVDAIVEVVGSTV